MGNYKIKVNIEIVECPDGEGMGECLENDGCFEMTMGEKDAESIDQCESSVMETAHPAIRKALAKHLEEMSKKKSSEKAEEGQKIALNRKPYRIDGEAGRFEFATHSVVDRDDRLVFNSAADFFPALGSREYYRTVGFKEIAYVFGDTEKSFRKTAEAINRFRRQEIGGTPYRTLQETTLKEGEQIMDSMDEKARECLVENGFDERGQPESPDAEEWERETVVIDAGEARKAAETFSDRYDAERILGNRVCLESPESTVNVYIDDVNVKRQEEKRPRRSEPVERKRKYAHNTVCRVEKGNASYTINAGKIGTVLVLLVAFLVGNRLMKNRIQFFTDGHKSLNEAILKVFCWYSNIGIVLDWYHLCKKCKEQLSMALKGRKIRKRILGDLMPLLWHGLTDEAITYLAGIGSDDIKNQAAMDKLADYFVRNSSNIPCYALRKKLRLRNGSSIGEKMNDLIVSHRQKDNGMSWSKRGSVALATVTALIRNKEYRKWFERKELDFSFAV